VSDVNGIGPAAFMLIISAAAPANDRQVIAAGL